MSIHKHGEGTNIAILITEKFLARNNDLRATKLFRVKNKAEMHYQNKSLLIQEKPNYMKLFILSY